MRLIILCFCFALGSLWGHYGPVSVVLPGGCYAWSDSYGGDGCGMCPWHDEPEETQERERKEKERSDNGHCGAEGKPEREGNGAGAHNEKTNRQ